MRQIVKFVVAGAIGLTLAACSAASEESYAGSEGANIEVESSTDYAIAEEAAAGELAALASRPVIPVTLPRIAYVYDYGFSVPGAEIAGLQLRHADMCEALGPYRCRIVAMDASGYSDDIATGQLQLAVAAEEARAFVNELSATLEGVNGEQVRASITGEDLSKQMVDTEARLRSRIVLRDRLMDVLRTRTGDVSELVEAESSVARINEEIDQARSWMEEMRGRVAYSRVDLSYVSATPAASDFLGPVRAVLGSLDAILGNLLALLILLAAIGIPLALLVAGGRSAVRRFNERGQITGA